MEFFIPDDESFACLHGISIRHAKSQVIVVNDAFVNTSKGNEFQKTV